MDAVEMIDRLCFLSDLYRRQDLDVAIALADPGVGGSRISDIKYVTKGECDWHNDKILLYPDGDIVSFDYIEEYVPDIREMIAEERRKREHEAWVHMNDPDWVPSWKHETE